MVVYGVYSIQVRIGRSFNVLLKAFASRADAEAAVEYVSSRFGDGVARGYAIEEIPIH